MQSYILEMLIKAKDMASGELQKASQAMKAMEGQIKQAAEQMDNITSGAMQRMNSGFQAVGGMLKTGVVVGTIAAVGAFGVLGKTAIDNAANMEKYRSTLTTMLGSQQLANERLKEYADIGAKTPFELPQVVALGNQLQAIGKYSRNNVNMLGDLASAAGKPIEQVSAAFSKLATGQKGIAVDMFRDLSITTDDWVKATGKGITKSGELMATTEEMMAVLPKIMKDKKFTGMMEEQSQTFLGKMSNLADAWNQKLTQVGEKILPAIKPHLDTLIAFISSVDVDSTIESFTNLYNTLFKGDFTGGIFGLEEDSQVVSNLLAIYNAANNTFAFFQKLPGTIQPLIDKFNEFFGIFTQSKEFDLFKQTFDSVYKAIMDAMPFILALVAIIGVYLAGAVQLGIYAFQQLYPVFLELWQAVINLWNAVQPLVLVLLGFAGMVMAILLPVFMIMISYVVLVAKAFGEMLSGIINILAGIIDFIIGVFTGDWKKAWKGIEEIFKGLGQFFKGAGDMILAPITAIFDGVMNFIKTFSLIEQGKNMIGGLIDGVKSMAGQFGGAIGDMIKNNIPGFARDALKSMPIAGDYFRSIPGFARGGMINTNGDVMVGENGPEILSGLAGRRVTNAETTQSILSGQSQPNNLITIKIDFKSLVKPTLDELNEIGRLVLLALKAQGVKI